MIDALTGKREVWGVFTSQP